MANIAAFDTSFDFIQNRINSIDPVAYGKSRNYVDGDVTYLSPYISRGVISTRQLLETVLEKGHSPKHIEKFIQELAWRDYWQQIWLAKGNLIDEDLKRPQPDSCNHGIPKNITLAKTGIKAIDSALQDFYKTGYLHNHIRMYVASLCTNMAKCHWSEPAKWMYYYLLDADWASNALSWQWVAGANSNKKYYANQGNINKFCYSNQQNTFLDVSYEELTEMDVPSELQTIVPFNLRTHLPEPQSLSIKPSLPTLLYNFYNLDPNWKKETEANRILLLEPSHFEKYPVSDQSLAFAMNLGKNIEGLQIYAGEFHELIESYAIDKPYFKEHPTNAHYQGIEEPRDWMFSVKGYYPSFFSFWKKCKKELTW
jgi:deoxyribodipyrimidine photo-lyase